MVLFHDIPNPAFGGKTYVTIPKLPNEYFIKYEIKGDITESSCLELALSVANAKKNLMAVIRNEENYIISNVDRQFKVSI